MYKGDRSVGNIYLSERDAWLEQGWSESPVLVQPVSEPEPEEEIVVNDSAIDRHAELSAMDWRELKKLATSFGLEKTSTQTWDEIIPDILKAENR